MRAEWAAEMKQESESQSESETGSSDADGEGSSGSTEEVLDYSSSDDDGETGARRTTRNACGCVRGAEYEVQRVVDMQHTCLWDTHTDRWLRFYDLVWSKTKRTKPWWGNELHMSCDELIDRFLC